MGMNASSGGSGRVDVVKVVHPVEREVAEGRTGGWFRKSWRLMRTHWIVVGLRVDNNPVWIAMTLIVILLMLLIPFLSIWIYDFKYDGPADFMYKAIGDPFKSAVHNRLLCSENQCDGNVHKFESPIGDYLALEVVICFVTDLAERMLRRGAKSEQGLFQSRRMHPFRAGVIALIIVFNFVLTSTISYGYLWPLPPEPPLKVFYWMLVLFVFGVGVVRPCLGVQRAFPETPKLILDAIHAREKDVQQLLKRHQNRKEKLEEEIRDLERKTDDISSPSSSWEYLCDCWWRWRLKKKEESRDFDPKNSILHQMSGNMLIRLAIGGFVVCAPLFMRQPILVVQIVVVGATVLLLMGCADGIAFYSGVFIGGRGKNILLVVNSVVLIAYIFTVFALSKAVLDSWHVVMVVVISFVLLFLAEIVCFMLLFEGRDFEVASIVWILHSLEFDVDLLRVRLAQKWNRRQNSSMGLSSEISRRSSWPLCRSRCSPACQSVQGRSVRMRRAR